MRARAVPDTFVVKPGRLQRGPPAEGSGSASMPSPGRWWCFRAVP